MQAIFRLHDSIFNRLEAYLGPWLMPTLARFAFTAVLAGYFWNSAKTKVGDGIMGIFSPSFGAYTQILPRQIEAAGYDADLIGPIGNLTVLLGTWAEFVLPALVIIGLFTRFASLGMIGFIVVQSYVDVVGHGVDATTIGSYFDRIPDSAILDQRLLWISLLLLLVVRGGGPFSVDRLIGRS